MLRFVDAWACREGTPEDEEDEKAMRNTDSSSADDDAFFVVTSGAQKDMGDNNPAGHTRQSSHYNSDVDLQIPKTAMTTTTAATPSSSNNNSNNNNNNNEEWVELDLHEPRPLRDEEAGDK